MTHEELRREMMRRYAPNASRSIEQERDEARELAKAAQMECVKMRNELCVLGGKLRLARQEASIWRARKGAADRVIVNGEANEKIVDELCDANDELVVRMTAGKLMSIYDGAAEEARRIADGQVAHFRRLYESVAESQRGLVKQLEAMRTVPNDVSLGTVLYDLSGAPAGTQVRMSVEQLRALVGSGEK